MRFFHAREVGIVAASLSLATLSTATSTEPWLDVSLPFEVRLQAFLATLNETQIYAMVQGDTELTDNGTGVNACIGHITGNSTIGIPDICMGDGPVGVGNSLNNVTAFPAPVMAASAWNETLEYVYGQVLANEHMMKGRNIILSPTINILRSPLWARAAETFSEDPFLTSRLSVGQVEGIQSQHALACPKHFAAYNQDTNRFGLDPEWVAVNVVVDERTLHELYLPAFKASVTEAEAASVMCSYNQLNGHYTCENEWLLNKTLKTDWGFDGFVVADWYFADRSTVAAALNGLDNSMPGGSLVDSYGFPAYYADLLVEAVDNGSVPFSRVVDMAARLWRPMFKFGAIENTPPGNSTAVARTQAHLDLAQHMAEEGMVLLKNDNELLPLSGEKYSKIAVFGIDATNQSAVSEQHGGFVIDSTMVVQAPFDYIEARGAEEGISVKYSEAYPGTGELGTVPSSMFSDLTATYYTTADWSGPVNQTVQISNITAATYPEELWVSWPQVFSCIYEGTFYPNTTGLYHFSLTGQGDAQLYIDGKFVTLMEKQNFGNTVSGVIDLTADVPVSIALNYSMGYSLSTGGYGVTLGVDVANDERVDDANELAEWADLSIVFVSDRWSEGADSNLGLSLPGDQDALISTLASKSKKTLVVLNTNSAILMPWLDEVDGVLEAWYPGQQIGSAIERVLYGDISPSGRLTLTFPKSLEDTIQISSNLTAEFDEGLYVGYKWYDQNNVEPLYPFGYGLSYTTFNMSSMDVTVIKYVCDTTTFSVNSSVVITNTGSMDAKEVIQLYVAYPEAANEPPKLLRGFQKIALEAGKSATVTIEVKEEDLKIWSATTEDWEFISGDYEFMFAWNARDIILTETVSL